ncbi:expressed unknown protein (Partial), partial [Seminavis robusta]
LDSRSGSELLESTCSFQYFSLNGDVGLYDVVCGRAWSPVVPTIGMCD